jgi:hypothetical protein
MPERRFPPPWTVEKLDACFVVKDKRLAAEHRLKGDRNAHEEILQDSTGAPS